MAKDLKPHIGIFGRRNNGKSSIINRITGQETAIVSDTAGTTTDPVKKSIEIFGIGPVVLIDTAGMDDIGELGTQRIGKSLAVMSEIDCAVLVIAENTFGDTEKTIADRLAELAVPFIVVHNKADLQKLSESLKKEIETSYNTTVIDFSATQNASADVLIDLIKKTIPQSAYLKVSLLGGIVKPSDSVLLVCPIDSEAPEGRMILPQVMTIRDALDNDCICTVIKETSLEHYLARMPKPDLVITDSQVFDYVSKTVPQDVMLTSFSIVMARLRGDFENYIKDTPHLSQLKDGDKILMLESCIHQTSCEDIGRVKLPRLIRKFTKKDVNFDYISGLAPINGIEQYAMVIQCGGCMSTHRQLTNRTGLAVKAGVPISNYGMSMAYMTGIFDRVLEPFRRSLAIE